MTKIFHLECTMVEWLSLLHNLIQQILISSSVQVQILLVVYRRSAMMRTSGNGHCWKLGLTPLNANPTKWSNTLKQFIGNSRRIIWVCLTILWGWRLKF